MRRKARRARKSPLGRASRSCFSFKSVLFQLGAFFSLTAGDPRDLANDPSLRQGRNAFVPVGCILPGPTDAQGQRFLAAATNDLQR